MKIGSYEVGLLDYFLVFVPIAFVLHYAHADASWVFITSGLAIIPLAGILGEATEHLSEHVGPGIGGLLNATFGNAAELIIAIFALNAGLYGVVKASITGSIIGNLLLVLGASMLAGAPVQDPKLQRDGRWNELDTADSEHRRASGPRRVLLSAYQPWRRRG